MAENFWNTKPVISAKTPQRHTFFIVIGEWSDRRTAAIALIELAERLEKQDLMFCDVKGDNFGWLEDGRAILLDSDSLFNSKELGEIIMV